MGCGELAKVYLHLPMLGVFKGAGLALATKPVAQEQSGRLGLCTWL
jgi:hypothetical protein